MKVIFLSSLPKDFVIPVMDFSKYHLCPICHWYRKCCNPYPERCIEETEKEKVCRRCRKSKNKATISAVNLWDTIKYKLKEN